MNKEVPKKESINESWKGTSDSVGEEPHFLFGAYILIVEPFIYINSTRTIHYNTIPVIYTI